MKSNENAKNLAIPTVTPVAPAFYFRMWNRLVYYSLSSSLISPWQNFTKIISKSITWSHSLFTWPGCLKRRRIRNRPIALTSSQFLIKKIWTIKSLQKHHPHHPSTLRIQLAKGRKRYWQIVRIDWWSHASVDLLASRSVHGASTNLRVPLVGDSDRGCFLEHWKRGLKRRSQCNGAR